MRRFRNADAVKAGADQRQESDGAKFTDSAADIDINESVRKTGVNKCKHIRDGFLFEDLPEGKKSDDCGKNIDGKNKDLECRIDGKSDETEKDRKV